MFRAVAQAEEAYLVKFIHDLDAVAEEGTSSSRSKVSRKNLKEVMVLLHSPLGELPEDFLVSENVGLLPVYLFELERGYFLPERKEGRPGKVLQERLYSIILKHGAMPKVKVHFDKIFNPVLKDAKARLV